MNLSHMPDPRAREREVFLIDNKYNYVRIKNVLEITNSYTLSTGKVWFKLTVHTPRHFESCAKISSKEKFSDLIKSKAISNKFMNFLKNC